MYFWMQQDIQWEKWERLFIHQEMIGLWKVEADVGRTMVDKFEGFMMSAEMFLHFDKNYKCFYTK